MIDILIILVFAWLLVKGIKLAFRLTWGLAKLVGSLLLLAALPVLILCLIFAGGLVLLVPLAMGGIAVGILSACV